MNFLKRLLLLYVNLFTGLTSIQDTAISTLKEKTVLSVLDFSIFDLKSEPRSTHTKNPKIVIEVFSVCELTFKNGRS